MRNFVLLRARWLAGSGWLLGLLLALASAAPAWAQVPTSTNPYDVNPAAPPLVRPDTATVRKITKKEKRAQHAADSAKRTERLFGLHLTRPEKAGILALIPSGGQIYNKRYWKLPIVYGMVGGLGYWVRFQFKYYYLYREGYYNVLKNGVPIGSAELGPILATEPSLNSIYNNFTGARSFLDLSILLSALGYSLQILDAVVDAHLHDFDVSDNLSLNWEPTMVPVPGQAAFAPGLTLTLRAK
jgi:hypothetical protein